MEGTNSIRGSHCRHSMVRDIPSQSVFLRGERMEFIYESLDVQPDAIVLDAAELAKINEIAFTPLTAEQVHIFAAKLIDDVTTGNGRKWTCEFQEDAVKRGLFLGAPISFNHSTSEALMGRGRIYSAEIRGNAIYGRGYIDLTAPDGPAIAERIKDGFLAPMSIGTNVHCETMDGVKHVVPHPDNRILEVSFVLGKKPGCHDCGVVATEAKDKDKKCDCKNTKPGKCKCKTKANETHTETLLEFAESQLAGLRQEYVRVAGLSLGTKIKKSVYESVAESVDPTTLKTIVDDLKCLYESQGKKSESVPSDTDKLTAEVERLRNQIGV